MIAARKPGAAEPHDPWRQLAAGVIHLAILDAGGRGLRNYRTPQRTALQAQAQRWLLSNTGAEFMRLLDLSHESVLDALTSLALAESPKRGKYDHEQPQQS